MFQYTSEVILNNNKGNLLPVGADEAVRFALLDAKTGEVSDGGSEAKFVVDGVTAFDACDVRAIYHTAYADPAAAVVELDLTAGTFVEGAVYRLVVNLSEQGRSSSILQNAYLRKQRPFVYEVVAESTDAEDIANQFAALIKKEMASTDFRFFSAKAESGVLTLTALDCYTRFARPNGVIPSVGEKVLEFVKVLPVVPGDTGYESKEVVAGVAGEVITVGTEGAGTVAQIIKNLRIPTSASTDPFHGDHGGMPVPGGKYDQYLIEVETKRRHIAGTVVGSIDESLTSFVFFVEQALVGEGSGAAGEWSEAMAALAAAAGLETSGSTGVLETEDDLVAAGSGSAEMVLDAKVPHGVGNIG